MRHDWHSVGGGDWEVIECRNCGRHAFGNQDRFINLLARVFKRWRCHAVPAAAAEQWPWTDAYIENRCQHVEMCAEIDRLRAKER